jgi:branched-chain amino acid transport system ATP-binding protein
MTEAPLLHAERVSMHFGGLRALDEVSLSLAPRQIVGLIGPNGSGKSTFINVVSRIYEPSGGRVTFNARDMAGVPVHGVPTLGISRTFQNVRLFATMTVHDNLLVGDTPLMRTGLLRAGLALPSVRREERIIEDKVARVAELLGFRPHLQRIAGDLPYGLQKLVELGRALMPDPRLVLLDEPVAGMNPADKQGLIAALSRVRQSREVGFLLVEHDMNFVMTLAEHLYVLNFGKLIAEGPPERIQADPAVIAAYLGGAGRAEH